MTTQQKRLECPCGTVVHADHDDELVQLAQSHAREVHQMELTRQQALDMVVPE